MTQQLVLTPLGIVTEPNKLGQIPAGALSSMTECVERSPGVIQNMPSWTTRATIPSDAGTTAAFLIATPGPYMLVVFNVTAGWRYCWFDQTTGAQLFGGTQQLRIQGQSANNESIPLATQPGFTAAIVGQQIFLNTYSNVLVWDTYTPTSTATATPRQAGMPVPILTAVGFGGGGTALSPSTYAHYVVVAKRTVGDKVIVSEPSFALSVDSGGSSINVEVDVDLVKGSSTAVFAEGDTIEVYRTTSKPSGIASTFAAYQRGEEAGSEYRKSTSYVLTAADVASSTYIVIIDSTPDSGLGEALYTNQAVSGAGAAAAAPPAVRLLTAYKGYLFGFSVTRTPTILIRPTGYWGIAEASMTAEQIAAGTGRVQLVGATYSNGGTTVSLSPTSQLATLGVGMQVFGTGLAGNTITAIGGSSFTISPAASAAGSSVAIDASDVFVISAGGGAAKTYFVEDWDNLTGGLNSGTGPGRYLLLQALSLKLPPYSASANVFRTQPTDGIQISNRAGFETRPPMTLAISRGYNWDPRIPDPTATPRSIPYEVKPADMIWSEGGAPESWPLIQRDTFARGTPCAVASTRDAIIAFYTDAIWRVSGTGGTAGKGYDWRFDPIATNITANGSQALAVLSDVVYAQTSDGLIGISDSAIQKITQGRVHDQLDCPPWTDGPYTTATARFTVADEEHNEILFREPSAATGRMWLYNTNTDRLAQTISHEAPFHGDYSRFLRLPLVIGRDGSSTWTVKAQSGSNANFSLTYATVYADNPFAQRHWQVLNVSAETTGTVTITPTFNGVAGAARTLGADGRCAFEVPRNAPAIGNTMQVALSVSANGNLVKLHGFSLDYRDHTERRGNR